MEDDNDSGARSMLNFGIGQTPMDEYGRCFIKGRGGRDPSTHRIIEKRRRDRMNNCLADLSALIPPSFMKQGQGRIEKTEIIEMAIRHIKELEDKNKEDGISESSKFKDKGFVDGFKACSNQVINFLVNQQGITPSDPLCINLLQCLQKKLKVLESDSPDVTAGSPPNVEQLNSESQQSSPERVFLTPLTTLSHENQEVNNPVNCPSLDTSSQIANSSNDPSDGSMSQVSFSETGSSLKNTTKGHLDYTGPVEMDKKVLANNISRWLDMPMTHNDQDMSYSESMSSCTCTDSSCREHTSDGSKPLSAYKYKNIIQKRFIERNGVKGVDEEGSGQLRNDKLGEGSQPPTSDIAMLYQKFDCENGNNNSSSNTSSSSSESYEDNLKPVTNLDLVNSVPGFALHPGGTFYIPIITPASQLQKHLQSHPDNAGVCYPVNIPVNFGGPYISASNICATESGLKQDVHMQNMRKRKQHHHHHQHYLPRQSLYHT